MSTTDPLRHHSPTVWGLIAGGIAAGAICVGTVAWNAWEYRADIIRWLKF